MTKPKTDLDYKRVMVRFNEEHTFLLERAAERVGLTITAFVRTAAVKEANRIILAAALANNAPASKGTP